MKNEKYKIEIGSPPTGSLPTGEGGGRGRGAVALLLSIPLFLLLNLAVGSVSIPLDAVFGILMGADCDNEVWTNIVLHTRLPQSLTAIACGSGLAVAGLMLQTVFHKRDARPAIIFARHIGRVQAAGQILAVHLMDIGVGIGFLLAPPHTPL